ncbi:MAG TPA: hypothetical protein VMT00_04210 [Thermoanaerobaculia bacterium]|nr:hypothetical protein [Thermoanaerobaculia bacterium]
MPKTKQAQEVNLDWYLVSIDRLKKIGLVLLLVILGTTGYFYYQYRNNNPKLRAVSAISDAQDTLNRLAASERFSDFRSEFDRSRAKLEEARALLAEENFAEALSAGVESQTIAQAALARQPGEQDSDAQFLSVEGEVSYQKPGSDWKSAEVRAPLFNGDWVKTGNHSTAELMFANGSLYTIGHNALLEIYSLVNPATSKKQNTVKMQIGSIEVNTDDEISTVNTPGTQVVVDSKSTAQVDVDDANNARIFSLRGTTSVTPVSGGPAIQLGSGEKIRATGEGTLSEVTRIISPPALTSPAENRVFQAAPGLKVDLLWNAQQGARAYQLQVSRSRLFGRLEIDSQQAQTKATTMVTDEGPFYWRVASIDQNGEVGPFSTFRRFRVVGSSRVSPQILQQDKTPPSLSVKRPFNIGGQFYMIEGQVEPGASVFINDAEIDVDTSGVFKKFMGLEKIGWNKVVITAVDAAGNRTIRTENVYVEE